MIKHSSIIFHNVSKIEWNDSLQMLFGISVVKYSDLIIIYILENNRYRYKILKNRFNGIHGETEDVNVVSELLRQAYGVKPAQPEIQRRNGQRFKF